MYLTSQPTDQSLPIVQNATVLQRDDVGERQAIFRIRPLSGPVPEFEPGQYITLGLPAPSRRAAANSGQPTIRLIKRPYSIASGRDTRDYYEIYAVRVKDGRFTTPLWSLSAGDRLWMDACARGTFTLEGVPRDATVIMVATGTGIAPFMSMLRSFAGESRWAQCTLIHGARRVFDLAYREELVALTQVHPLIAYIPVVSREPEESGWSGMRGRVQQALSKLREFGNADPLEKSKHCHVFLCGNPDMIRSIRGLLAPLTSGSSPRATIHVERYW